MTLAWIFALGLLHGVHPDHASAAAAMSARSGARAWRAALQVAAGHGLALLVAASAIQFVPSRFLTTLESASDRIGGVALALVGIAIVVTALRPHARALDDSSTPLRKPGALGLGLALGLSGARSTLVLLPAMAGPGRAVVAVALFCAGIALGCTAISGALDFARMAIGRHGKWFDLATGAAALLCGLRLVSP